MIYHQRFPAILLSPDVPSSASRRKSRMRKSPRKEKARGGPQAIARKKAKERELVVPKEKARERRERRPRRKVLARTSATTE